MEIENLLYGVFLVLGFALIVFGLATYRNNLPDDPEDARLRAIQEKFRAVHTRARRPKNARAQNDPRDKRLQAIQERFRAAHLRAIRSEKMRRQFLRWGAAVLGLLMILSVIQMLSPWPLMVTFRHIAAFPNCDMARLVRLAPSSSGDAGYYNRHDRDGDGVACEDFPH